MTRFAVARAETADSPEKMYCVVPRIETPDGSLAFENAVVAPVEGSLEELRQMLLKMLALVNIAIAKPETIVEISSDLLCAPIDGEDLVQD